MTERSVPEKRWRCVCAYDGGALAGWLLAFYNYQADVAQTAATQQGILLSFTVLPAIGSVLVALVMSRYRLNAARVLDIHQQLQQKIA